MTLPATGHAPAARTTGRHRTRPSSATAPGTARSVFDHRYQHPGAGWRLAGGTARYRSRPGARACRPGVRLTWPGVRARPGPGSRPRRRAADAGPGGTPRTGRPRRPGPASPYGPTPAPYRSDLPRSNPPVRPRLVRPTSPVRRTRPPGYSPAAPRRDRRGARRAVVIARYVLAAVLVLCLAAVSAASSAARHRHRRGATDPAAAVAGVPAGRLPRPGPGRAARLVCSQARDESALARKIAGDLDYARRLRRARATRWSSPEVVDQDASGPSSRPRSP